MGKSFLINVLSKWIEFILRFPGDHPFKPKVLLMGPTGMAASLIGKLFRIIYSKLSTDQLHFIKHF